MRNSILFGFVHLIYEQIHTNPVCQTRRDVRKLRKGLWWKVSPLLVDGRTHTHGHDHAHSHGHGRAHRHVALLVTFCVRVKQWETQAVFLQKMLKKTFIFQCKNSVKSNLLTVFIYPKKKKSKISKLINCIFTDKKHFTCNDMKLQHLQSHDNTKAIFTQK